MQASNTMPLIHQYSAHVTHLDTWPTYQCYVFLVNMEDIISADAII